LVAEIGKARSTIEVHRARSGKNFSRKELLAERTSRLIEGNVCDTLRSTEGIMATVALASEAPNPQLVWETVNGYQRTAALRTAIELELFTAIGAGATVAPELAKRCGASERGVRILCDYLTVIGLLTKAGGAYRLTPTSAVFLDGRSPASMGSISRFLNSPKLMSGFANLTETVRRGTTQLSDGGCIAPEYDQWPTFAESMTPIMKAASVFIAEQVASDGAQPPLRVLDIAAGHGLFGIEVAKAFPQAEIVAQDWPKVLDVAKKNATAAGVSDRYQMLPGDAFAVEFGNGYDLVLLMNFLHHFDQSTCVQLLTKIHAALSPHGRLIALEFVPDEDRVSPPIPASFSLMMLGLTPAGDAYTASEHLAMAREAGFPESRLVAVPHAPQQLIISRKTAAFSG
jgi:ubiquinone/menaquinone biosynthesis C-methylase UbiE